MDPLQFIVITGAAGAFFWVLKWIVDGKLHADSEVKGLRDDKKALFTANKELSDAVVGANSGLAAMLPLLNEILKLLREDDLVREEEEGDK